jgi:hypothetical protein
MHFGLDKAGALKADKQRSLRATTGKTDGCTPPKEGKPGGRHTESNVVNTTPDIIRARKNTHWHVPLLNTIVGG